MNTSKISVRYAKALFLTAREENLLDGVHEDMMLMDTAYDIEGFKSFLESPVIKVSDKKELVSSVFGTSITELTARFIDLIIDNKRETFLKGIIRNYKTLYNQEKGINESILIVPEKVTEKEQQKYSELLEKLFNTRVKLEQVIKPELIGGFILRIGDQQFDASVKTSLTRIKKDLLENVIVN